MAGPATIEDLDDPGRVFATPGRRRRAATTLTAVALAVAIWNAPIPGFRSAYQDATGVAYELVRLDQGWSYFSPDVGLVSPEVWVEIDRIDGTTDRWDFPDEFPVFGTFRGYRWIKFDEAVAFGAEDYEPILDWVERNGDDPSSMREIHLVIALTAPTSGDHGPYAPDYTSSREAERTLIAEGSEP